MIRSWLARDVEPRASLAEIFEIADAQGDGCLHPIGSCCAALACVRECLVRIRVCGRRDLRHLMTVANGEAWFAVGAK